MKKKEAKILSIDKSNLLIEYMDQFLSDHDIEASIEVGFSKIDGEDMAIYNLAVPKRNFYRGNMNTGITLQQCEALNEQILNDVVDHYLDSDTVSLSPFLTIRGANNFSGIVISGNNNVQIGLNFAMGNRAWFDLSKEYNNKIKEYENKANTKTK